MALPHKESPNCLTPIGAVVRLPEPNIVAKRLFDLPLAVPTVILSPVLLLIAALVYVRFGRSVVFLKGVQGSMGVRSKIGNSKRW